jgi:fumarate reductase subunit C
MAMRLYILQRLTAALMVPLIIGHLIVMFYATRKGLTAADILGRTRGSLAWGAFYGVFVIAASIHGAIGLRAVAGEWLGFSPRARDFVLWASGAVMLTLGVRAVVAVVFAS